MGKISDEMKWKIIEKVKSGESQRKVSTTLEIGFSTVHSIWKKYEETGSIENRIRTGRPPKLNEWQQRILCRNSRKDPFRTAREVYNESFCLPELSICTVRRYLCKCGLQGRIAYKKPLLNKKQIQKRLSWCKAYSKYTDTQWKNVIFSDESRFETHPTRRRYVRRPIKNGLKNIYTCKTLKYGGFSLLVWGAIKGDGTRILKQCPIRLNSTAYQVILTEALMPILDNNSIFIQDSAPCHKSLSTISFLENLGVCYVADWPPQSPDLNIIENLWSIVKEKVSKRSPLSKSNLWEIVEEEWYKIDKSVIIGLFSSMRKRIQMVLKNKGLNTKY